MINDDMKRRLSNISEAFNVLLKTLEENWLPGRTMAIAQTKIEEAHMWLMQMPTDPTIKMVQDKQKEEGKIIPVNTLTPELRNEIAKEIAKN